MGLIEDAAEIVETEITNLKLNVQDTVAALEHEYAGSLWRGGGRGRRMKGWKDGGVEGWKGGVEGGVEGWRDGRMEGWKDGGVEGWKGGVEGGVEGWRDGRMEGWKDGREGWREER